MTEAEALAHINANWGTTLSLERIEEVARDTISRYRRDPLGRFRLALFEAIEAAGIVLEDEREAAKRAVSTILHIRRKRRGPSKPPPEWEAAAGPWWQGRD